jgi:type IV pilus assembly protein PilB
MAAEHKEIDVSRLDRSLADVIPFYYARKYSMLPICAIGSKVVVITPSGDSDPFVMGRIGHELNISLIAYNIRLYPKEEIAAAIEDFYKNKSLRLGELLLINEVLNERQLNEVLGIKSQSPEKKIGEIIKELGYAGEEELQQAYADQQRLKFLDISESKFIDLNLLSKVPKEMLSEERILPVPSAESERGVYLLSDFPVSSERLKEIGEILHITDVETVLVVSSDLDKAIESALKRLEILVTRDKTLGVMLLERDLISEEQLAQILEEQRNQNRKLGEIIIDKRILPEHVVMEAIASKLGCRYYRDLPMSFSEGIKGKIPLKFATYNKVVPIHQEKSTLLVAMTDPADKGLISTIKLAVNQEIEPVMASEKQIVEAIRRLYSDEKGDADDSKSVAKARIKLSENQDAVMFDGDLQYNTERVVNTVNNIMIEAVIQGASDIHLTPKENGLSLMLRIDGSLKLVNSYPPKDRDNIIARIKIMSDMRIDARHIPQGGRIVTNIEGRNIDFRVSTLPTQFGENVVLRILDNAKMIGSDLEKLGMPELLADEFLEHCERPQGIVLVTGPTGSGKTTTLYHVLNFLHDEYPQKSMSTIENPIEFVIEGIVQSEINDARGLNAAAILKEKLRQDPDIIMVGEIRNLEEGSLAFTAALTGHMVLSTLHTNDGAATIRRLVEMGLEAYNVSTGVNCILSQRLARRVCERCATDYTPTARELKKIKKSYPDFKMEDHNLKSGEGCDFCVDGFKGRQGIYELLVIDGELKKLIAEDATDSSIRAAAVSKGMKTLRMAGLDIAFKGLTTINEVMAVTDIMY